MRSTRNGLRLIDETTTSASTNLAIAAPPDFDPRRFPILAAHFFGRHQSASRLAEIIDFDRVRLAAALHRLGKTIGVNTGTRAEMQRRLAPQIHNHQPAELGAALIPGDRR